MTATPSVQRDEVSKRKPSSQGVYLTRFVGHRRIREGQSDRADPAVRSRPCAGPHWAAKLPVSELGMAVATAATGGLLVLRFLRDERFRRQEKASNAGRVLKSGTNHLRRIDDAVRDEVGILVRC